MAAGLAQPTEITTDLVVGGMTCAACVNRVEKKLGKLEGVVATVNLATGRARVTHPDSYAPEDLVVAVEQAGFTASLPEPPAAETAEGAGRRRVTRPPMRRPGSAIASS